jgi:hypothetical protein
MFINFDDLFVLLAIMGIVYGYCCLVLCVMSLFLVNMFNSGGSSRF